jgi:hypothetical protein
MEGESENQPEVEVIARPQLHLPYKVVSAFSGIKFSSSYLEATFA